MNRCGWATSDLLTEYHDTEWGVPVHDERVLFEFLILEGAQAGLSWETILKKRPAYREAFDNFVPERVASYDRSRIEQLMNNPGIVRNRRKVEAAVKNARAFLEFQKEEGSFDSFLWAFTEGRPIQNQWKSQAEIPAKTELSQRLSRELKSRGFAFVGPTICYAFMQAIGMVNDHTVDCFRHEEVAKLGARNVSPSNSESVGVSGETI